MSSLLTWTPAEAKPTESPDRAPAPAHRVVAPEKEPSAPSRDKPADPTRRAVDPPRGANLRSTPRDLRRLRTGGAGAPSGLRTGTSGLQVSTARTSASNAISRIAVSADLNCSADADAFPSHPGQFYRDTACATFLWVDGSIYGPNTIPAGPATDAWTPISRSSTGSGTSGDPVTIVTVVAAGSTSVRLTQTDTLVVDSPVWNTQVRIDNPQGRQVTRLTTARDCYVSGSDVGLGQADPTTGVTFCQGDSAALALVPGVDPATWYEGSFNSTWDLATTDADLPNTYNPASVDNGQALSWSLPAQGTVTRSWSSWLIAGPTSADAGAAPNPAVPPTTCSSARPVNCATGDFWHTFTDVAVPARGLPLALTRTYDVMNSAVASPFGYGWSFSWGLRLERTSATTMDVVQETGAVVSFTLRDGGWQAPSYVTARLRQQGSDWLFERPEAAQTSVFGADLQLREVRSDAGETLTVSRNSDGRLASVAHAGHGSIALTWTGDRITAVSDAVGNVTRYAYDARGDLVATTLPTGGRWRFGYDSRHLMISMTDPLGRQTVNTFDASLRVVSQRQPSGRTVTFSYAGDPSSATGSTTTMVDERGVSTRYSFANMLLLERERSGGGQQRTTRFSYDLVTLRLARTDDDGLVRSAAYDVQGRLVSATDARGYVTTYTYDGDSYRPASTTTPEGRVSSTAYDTRGRLVRVQNGSVVRTFDYADATHPADVTAAHEGERTTTFAYDPLGNVTLSRVASPTAAIVLQAQAYDAAGRLVCSVLPAAYTAGSRCGATEEAGRVGSTVNRLDGLGNIVETTDPAGGVTVHAYDLMGRLTSTRDAAGLTSSVGYDGNDRVSTLTRGTGSTAAVTTTTSDIAAGSADCPADPGTVTCVRVVGGGKTSVTGYDASGEVVSAVRPGGAKDRIERSGGLVRSVIRADGSTADYDYSGDRLTAVAESGGSSVSFGYDGDGLRTSMADSSGETVWEFDGRGSLAAETTSNGTVRGERDSYGDLVGITYPDGSTVRRSYDAGGRVRQITDWAGRVTQFSVDNNGAVTVTRLPNGRSILNSYGPSGDFSGVSVRAAGIDIAYRRDAMQRVVAEQGLNVPGGTSNLSYDRLGKLAAVNGVPTGSDDANNPTTVSGVAQSFDAAVALARQERPVDPLTFRTSVQGERTSAVAVNGDRTLYGYDDASRLTSLVSAQGPQLSALSLRSGPSAGGTAVTVTGSGFLPGSTVWFGSRAGRTTRVEPGRIETVAPAGSGTVAVTVTTAHGRSSVRPAGSYSYQGPSVVSLSSRSGIAAGGQTLTLTGWNLGGATAVRFGSVAARFTVVSSEKLTVTVPPGSGTPHVSVTTPQGSSAAVAADTYSYIAVPVVSGISPQSGPAKTQVTVTGANFTTASTVRFGTRAATAVKVVSATTLQATVPAATGTVHVTVTSTKGPSVSTVNDTFVVASGPRVDRLTPAAAAASGGTKVTVTGAGFSASSVVTVGGVRVSAGSVTATSMKITVPASTATSGYVQVRTGSLTSPKVSRALISYLRPAVTRLSVATGPAAGGQTLTVTGTRLTGATRVLVGGTAVTPRAVTATSLTVTTPPGSGSVGVRVVTPEGTGLEVAAGRYTFSTAPILTGVVTGLGAGLVAAQGGTEVRLTGFNLSELTQVRFGTVDVPVESAGDTSAVVLAPPGTSLATLSARTDTTAAISQSSLSVVYSDRDDRYVYDGLGRRVRSTDAAGVVTATVWDPFAADPVPLVHGGWRLITGSGRLPMAQIDGADQAYYPILDQRGSTRVLLDGSGAPVSTFAYGPYGATTGVTGPVLPVVGFAGGLSSANGLIWLGQRVLDPGTGTFLTVDPALIFSGDPYVYAGADPYNAVDRSGLFPVLVVSAAIGALAGAVVGGVAGGITYALTTDKPTRGGLAGALAGGVISGGISGGCLGSGVGIALGAICGAGGSMLGELADQGLQHAIDGTDFSAFDIGLAGVLGGVTGLAGPAVSRQLGTVTTGQLKSWSNLRNSTGWLHNRMDMDYLREALWGGIFAGAGTASYRWTKQLLEC